MEPHHQILSVLMADAPSAHERLTNCLRRRACGLLSVASTTGEEPGLVRLTVALRCTDAEAERCRLQVEKMIDVVEVTLLEEFLEIQLVLLRLEVSHEEQRAALGILERAGGRLLRQSGAALVAQLGDHPERIEAALADLRTFGPMTISRTGPVALAI